MKRFQTFGAMICLVSLGFGCSQPSNSSQELEPAIDLTAMDTTVSPRADFYLYANGNWLRNNPLPAAYSSYGSFHVLRDRSKAQIRGIVDELSATNPKAGTNEYRIATLYAQAMDSTTRNALGAQPIQEELAQVRALASKADVLRYAAQQDQEFGAGVLFGSYVFTDLKNSNINILHLGQTSLGMHTRDFYLEEGAQMDEIRKAYQAMLLRLGELSGYSAEEAQRIADNTIRLETELAKISYSQTELRDNLRNYNVLPISEVAAANKGFDWSSYFAQRGLSVETANFAQLDFFKAFSQWYEQVDLDALKDLLLAKIMRGSADALSDDFAQASFAFYGTAMEGRQEMKPRWERSVGVVEGTLGEALGEVYAKRYFSPEAKERMLKLVGNLQKALGERVKQLSWMSDSTKVQALEKLNGFTVKIGYPDKWRDYSKLEISSKNTYYQNLMAATRFEQADNIKDLGQPVDRTKWLMNVYDVNAYYMPTTNEICFPAGILQPPFFNMNADDAVNYGAIGVVIGHEMIHGFDDQGSHFDVNGNMQNWWTPSDKSKFDASTGRLVEQFSANEVLPGVMANGALTLGENIADQGGLTVAFEALKLAGGDSVAPIDGFTPAQRFFIAYARLWGRNMTDEAKLNNTKTDPHSLSELRVNQALKNIDAFHTAFDTQPGDAMYLAPEQRIYVW